MLFPFEKTKFCTATAHRYVKKKVIESIGSVETRTFERKIEI